MQIPKSLNSDFDRGAAFSATSSPYLILNPALLIVDVNNAYLQATQRSRDELLGEYMFDAFPNNPKDPDANGAKNLHDSLQRVLENHIADRMVVQKYDIPIGDPKEARFEERFWSPINTPIFDCCGNLTHIMHHVEDVTAQVRAEADLRESEAKYRELFNNMGEEVHFWELVRDEQRRIVTWRLKDANPPALKTWGRILKDIIGKTADEIFGPGTTAHYLPIVEKVMTEGVPHTFEDYLPHLDRHFRFTTVPLGQFFITTGADITDIKKAMDENVQLVAQLREANLRKDEFLAMLAHELRNPLAPISAGAELLRMVKLDEQRVLQTSEIIVRQVNHLTSLVDDLLDVSRVTRGLVKLDKQPLDIRNIVTEAIEQVNPLIQSRRHHLILDQTPDATMVMGDKKRLVQIVANLVNNAAKYTHEDGNILVKTTVHEKHVLLEVIDDGIGIEPGSVTRIFDLFTQAEVTPDRTSGGLGLGLALVKSLIELHDGTVTCESKGKGKGSKFTVCLPRLMNLDRQISQFNSRHMLQNGITALRILVVDDNIDAAAMLTLLLEAAGHTVFAEHGSKRALERARLEKPDVCLLDIGLPEMDGNELAQRLRSQPETARSVLIAVTGYGQEYDREKARAAGFAHLLVKPVVINQLAAILDEIKSD